MDLKRGLAIVALSITNCFVNSSVAHATAGYSTPGHIVSIEQSEGIHGVWIYTDTTVYNDGCGGSPTSYFLPDGDYSPANANFKAELALLMGAYVTGKTVSFYVVGYSYVGVPFVGSVRIF